MTVKRQLYLSATAVALVTLLVVMSVPSWAGPPLSGSGAGVITSVAETSSRDAGPNRIAERELEGVLNGTLVGTFTEHVRGVVHPDGQVTFHGTLEFTGMVGECGFGTITGRLQGRGRGNPPLTDATIQIVQQPSNTVAVTGHGTVHQDGPLLSYDLQYTCR